MLRSNFEEGTTRWAVRRTQWKSMGITNEELQKPKIAIINTSNELSCCYSHVDGIAQIVKSAIWEAGGVPFEIRTAAPSDFVTTAGKKARYLMPTRDLVVNEIECMVEGAVLDGMVCLCSCDKTAPAQMMASARMDIPSMLLACGYQIGGICSSGEFVDIDDVYEKVGAVASGDMALTQLTDMTNCAIQTPGVCAGLGTANSMHIVSEAIGMTLPGNAPIFSSGSKLKNYARMAGHNIVKMVKEHRTARQIITKKAIENAVMVVLAIGGSVNTVRHLAAIATEAEIDMDVVATYEKYADTIKLLTSVRPNGPFRTEDLEAAGGCNAVMKRLEKYLHLDQITVNGKRVGENIKNTVVKRPEVIKDFNNPQSNRPGIAILRGNLSPHGAIMKLSALPSKMDKFEGRAKIFEGEDEAIAAISKGEIHNGDAIVLRNMGPKGGPGTVFACSFVAALNGANLASNIAVITDGELSGLNRGIIIGQVMPEAAAGGPLAVIKDGELIKIDFVNRTINVDIPQKELNKRLAMWKPDKKNVTGYLGQYYQLVQPIEQGAVLGYRSFRDKK
ncbi:dihydroxy-acid dehydratase [Clostridium sp. HV4-5-A1G]|uniref:dihydroxy-acid dehydratase n=1 Tax=Clostridium sp. HV4-5-A1G TaxID=2004595 RepID=UPI00123ACB89|nr:dihydroxy-acid dehydratase [Clostridium sp. HV4-5-A1G]KAA8674490.1 dihydroxy-acid dehydratase [Clostridium sp. HV4-5-A1G]